MPSEMTTKLLPRSGQPSPDGWPQVLPSRATRHADIVRETLDGARGL